MILPQLVTVHDHEPDPAFEEVARAADAVYIEVLLHQLVSSAVKESRSCCVGSLPCVSSLENDIMSLIGAEIRRVETDERTRRAHGS